MGSRLFCYNISSFFVCLQLVFYSDYDFNALWFWMRNPVEGTAICGGLPDFLGAFSSGRVSSAATVPLSMSAALRDAKTESQDWFWTQRDKWWSWACVGPILGCMQGIVTDMPSGVCTWYRPFWIVAASKVLVTVHHHPASAPIVRSPSAHMAQMCTSYKLH
jgi:hypothetical protein